MRKKSNLLLHFEGNPAEIDLNAIPHEPGVSREHLERAGNIVASLSNLHYC